MKVETYHEYLPLKNKFKRLGWNACVLLSSRPFAGPLFWKWRNLLSCLFGVTVGRGSKINAPAEVWAPWNLEVGEHTVTGAGANYYNLGKIVLGLKVVASQEAYLCAVSHDIINPLNPLTTASIHIGSFAWTAAETFVNIGVAMGEDVVVSARATVFKGVDPRAVIGGSPVRFVKKCIIEE